MIKQKTPSLLKRFLLCAAKEIRTPTPFRALPPQSSASTNFAIAASFEMSCKSKLFEGILKRNFFFLAIAESLRNHTYTDRYRVQKIPPGGGIVYIMPFALRGLFSLLF